MTAVPRISVVIPVRNEAAKIAACLRGIYEQTVVVHEVIVLDSGSTDRTLEILSTFPNVRVVPIASQEFNHGETRNVGVGLATGELVLLTVGDARPADNRWIETLLSPLSDPAVVAVCGTQVVAHEPTTNPVEWFQPIDEPRVTRIQFAEQSAFDRLAPLEKMRMCSWDDVTSLYRREILLQIPFKRTSYAEDAIWARDALRAGHALAYAPSARVYHFHLESSDFAFRRALTSMFFRHREFGYVYEVPPVLAPLARDGYRLLKTRQLSWSERARWLRYNVRSQLAVRRAIRAFRRALGEGTGSLEALHNYYCGRPPIPEKAVADSVGRRAAAAAPPYGAAMSPTVEQVSSN